ncbi:hypothetical protein [Ferruginibacter sp. SUN106]|uniref:hypothetical protein n=1 Tax=Ferruginibacter sp. SUN106 TaxID=2978348 RepID=UPI003D367731
MIAERKIPLQTILLAGLLVGTLDILSAFVDVYVNTGKNPLIVLNYIATGAFGKTDFTASNGGAAVGLLFHYIIAFAFTILFFWLYTKSNFPSKNWVLTGIVYGLFIWAIMNFIVVPLSNVRTAPFTAFRLIKAALILIVMIGLPLSFIAGRFSKG